MVSRSAIVASERPFYDLHAEAYDALITDPIEPWVDAVSERLARTTSGAVLDAGCGTGRHARALIDRGFSVTLMDASEALMAIASKRCPEARTILADICSPDFSDEFAAVICRGVLNDLTEDDERKDAVESFSRIVSSGGTLIVDVRESAASQQRADGTWRRSQVMVPTGQRLTFASRPVWCGGRIRVDERYELTTADGVLLGRSEYTFWMRPWTHSELIARLTDSGFEQIEIRPGVGRRTPDRLLVTATRS